MGGQDGGVLALECDGSSDPTAPTSPLPSEHERKTATLRLQPDISWIFFFSALKKKQHINNNFSGLLS